MLETKTSYSNMDLDAEIKMTADQLLEDLTESNARLENRLQRQKMIMLSLKGIRNEV
jgi:hypothetical protein